MATSDAILPRSGSKERWVWPHIYGLKRDLDRFVTAMADAVAQVHRRELALQELTVADTCGQAIRRWAR
ncbi:hypothetical protein [Mesorhizobium sp. M0028]|uniref:hypothetical protein n=1 Tax=unclassified Mesorhizobium TaxID=325217 RepID=UPI003336E1E7